MKENLLYSRVNKCHTNSTGYILNISEEELKERRRISRSFLGLSLVISGLFLVLSFFMYLNSTSVSIFVVGWILIWFSIIYISEVKKAFKVRKTDNTLSLLEALKAKWVTESMRYLALNNFAEELIAEKLLVRDAKEENIKLLAEFACKLREAANIIKQEKDKWLSYLRIILVVFLGVVWNTFIERLSTGTPLLDILVFSFPLIMLCVFAPIFIKLIWYEEINRCNIICDRLNDLRIEFILKEHQDKLDSGK